MTDLPAPKRLVTCSTAPNPRRVAAVMAEKGIEIPLEEIDISTRAQYAPEHLAVFGTHHLPALELETGETLTETVAISRYLEALVPEPNLLGRDPLEAARIEMWQRRMEFMVMLPVGFLFRHTHPSMAVMEDQVTDWGEANRPRVLQGLAFLDERLSDSAYVAGDRFTIADVTAYIALDFMRVTRVPIAEGQTGIRRWQAELSERPSLQRRR